jgi:hypothetical protein
MFGFLPVNVVCDVLIQILQLVKLRRAVRLKWMAVNLDDILLPL